MKITVFLVISAIVVMTTTTVAIGPDPGISLLIPKQMQTKDWWETASLYQIYPRSFKDSNGDGIGDLNGIREKLPYLKSLGISAFWLSPIFLSPMKDFGYDIQDFFSIQPEYGTMDDFDAMVKEATHLGLKVILDFVPNHSSDLNEWFIKSAQREAGFEDFYMWHPGYEDSNNAGQRLPPNNWLSVFRGSGWTWNEIRGEFYYHAFAIQQPDLNYRNPKVVEMMKSVLRFWLDRGVSGFRVDAVPHLFEVLPDSYGRYPDEPLSGDTDDALDYGYLKHIFTQSQNETFDMVYQWRDVLDDYQRAHGGDTRIMLTEAYIDIDLIMKFYEDGSGRLGSHIPMNFYMIMNLNKESNAADFKRQIDLWMTHMPNGRTANWVLGNHDQRRVASRFGTNRIDMLNMIDLTLPGVSITYNGEEIGMTDVWISWDDTKDPQACNTNPEVYDAHSRDPARTPFQWNASTSAGFSTNPNTWLPVSPTYQLVNVRVQEGTYRSHLKIYRQLINLRQRDTFRYGDIELYSILNDQVLVIVRELDDFHDTYIVVANFGSETEMVDLRGLLNKNWPRSVRYEILDSESERTPGDTAQSRISVFPSESFVLCVPAPQSEKYFKYEVVEDGPDVA